MPRSCRCSSNVTLRSERGREGRQDIAILGEEPSKKDKDPRSTKSTAKLLRPQEPRQHGCQAQADPAVCRDRCERACSRKLAGLVNRTNTSADGAYRSAATE